jgi:hypothetical protein
MQAKQKTGIRLGTFGLLILFSAAWLLPAQQAATPAGTENNQAQSDPLAELSPENRVLFDAIREAAKSGQDADVLADGKKLMPALKPNSPLADFVTLLTAQAAIETGENDYSLALAKPLVDAHPDDWHASALLARLYAENGEKTLRDQQIAHLITLHKQTSDAAFAQLHIFPIQKVKLKSGYAVFLYPFEPLPPHNTYLLALIYTDNAQDKAENHIQLESDDVDQAFFKPKKPGERRFSIDTYSESEVNGKQTESQALHGFIDGVFNYETMRDLMVKTANGEPLPQHN